MAFWQSEIVTDTCALDIDIARPIAEAAFAECSLRLRLPSLAWGVVIGGEVVLGQSTDVVYRIASMTKSFTCAALLTLRDEGRMALDEPVATYAPEFVGLRWPTDDSPPITVRHLMTMSSGLATDDAWADRHLDMTDAELDDHIDGGLVFAAVPGTTFEYSNLGFAILGRVVHNITEAPVQRLITERLLEPLGMTNTTWTEPAGAIPGRRERNGNDEELIVEPSLGDGVMAPMGGLFTTVDDLAKWVDFLGSAFRPGDGRSSVPLSRPSRREMQQVSRVYFNQATSTELGHAGRQGGYGFGLNVLPHDGLGSVVTHSGGLPGFGSNMRWVPRLGIGVVALANSTYAPMAELTASVLDALVASGALRFAPLAPGDGLIAIAHQMVALINGWDDEAADAMFADSVDLDEPRTERRSQATELCADHGPFTFARLIVESGASATVIAHGPAVELHIDFQLAPTKPLRVQYFGTTVHT